MATAQIAEVTVKTSAFLLACVVGIACGAPTELFDPDSIKVQLSSDRFLQGDTVVVEIINGSGRTLQYNLCPMLLEHQQSNPDLWERVTEPSPYPQGCNAGLMSLPAGDTVVARRRIPTDAPSGTYRLRFLALVTSDADIAQRAQSMQSSTFSVRQLGPIP